MNKGSTNVVQLPHHNVFICPACRAELSRLDHSVVQLRGRLSCPTFSVTATFSLSSTLGCYGVMVADELELRDGARIDFRCPACDRSFTSPANDRLSVIHMLEAGTGREMAIVFDRVYGEHSSFVIDVERGELVGSYGEHSALFEDQLLHHAPNFFGC